MKWQINICNFPNAEKRTTLRIPREELFIKCNLCWRWGQFVSVGRGADTIQPRRPVSCQCSAPCLHSEFSQLCVICHLCLHSYYISDNKALLAEKQHWKKKLIVGVHLAGLLSQHMSNRKTVCLKALCTSILWKRKDLDVMLTDGGFCHSKWWILIICFFKPIHFIIIIIKISFFHRCWCPSEV